MFAVFKKQAAPPPPREIEPAGLAPVDATRTVAAIARQTSTLGREATEVLALIDDTGAIARRQVEVLATLSNCTGEVTRAQQDIASHTQESLAAVAQARQAVEQVGQEVAGIVDTLRGVAAAAAEITQIALRTRLVAFNASVEAKRARRHRRAWPRPTH